MRTVLLVAVVVLALASCVSVAKARTALEMASYCKPVAEAQPTGDGGVSFKHDWQTGECWGFFSAIRLATGFYDEKLVPLLHICAPPRVGVVQLVLIFRRYVEINPSKGHELAFYIAINALVEASPCKG